jgi:hypothetical protein
MNLKLRFLERLFPWPTALTYQKTQLGIIEFSGCKREPLFLFTTRKNIILQFLASLLWKTIKATQLGSVSGSHEKEKKMLNTGSPVLTSENEKNTLFIYDIIFFDFLVASGEKKNYL